MKKNKCKQREHYSASLNALVTMASEPELTECQEDFFSPGLRGRTCWLIDFTKKKCFID